MTICIHCNKVCRLGDSKEVYPYQSQYWGKPVWICTCGAYVGCHTGTTKSLGFAANHETRRARMILHKEMLDPLWMGKGKKARRSVYRFLAGKMGLTKHECHIGMFTIEQCREAWMILKEYK